MSLLDLIPDILGLLFWRQRNDSCHKCGNRLKYVAGTMKNNAQCVMCDCVFQRAGSGWQLIERNKEPGSVTRHG